MSNEPIQVIEDLTEEEIQMVNEALEHYEKHPETAKTWERIREGIKEKYWF